MSTVYSAAAVRGLVDTLICYVRDEPKPENEPCEKDWRWRRMREVVQAAFADQHGPPDGSMPWHKFMPRMCPSPMRDGHVTAADCIAAGECGCDEGLNQER